LEYLLLEDESNHKAGVGTKEQRSSADMETGSDELRSLLSEETETEEPVLVPPVDKRNETTQAEVSESI
jgi:hypothetical protein